MGAGAVPAAPQAEATPASAQVRVVSPPGADTLTARAGRAGPSPPAGACTGSDAQARDAASRPRRVDPAELDRGGWTGWSGARRAGCCRLSWCPAARPRESGVFNALKRRHRKPCRNLGCFVPCITVAPPHPPPKAAFCPQPLPEMQVFAESTTLSSQFLDTSQFMSPVQVFIRPGFADRCHRFCKTSEAETKEKFTISPECLLMS
ncbi:uncharacterized protein LOC123816401 [Phyllostomus hastatus]|uniref:uncharacterized protein LOC123816401 n=1 Tax=Phyllostomus hastatus TaxID=9423 RepID=UPI001E68597C|nr:uncharacterized protein LOC123816401 [Phyllostomus hastatus]